MLIDVRAIGFPMNEALQRHAEYRVESEMGIIARHVLKVTVRLEDVNAQRGGIDKRCGVTVAMRHNRTVIAEAVNMDMYAAVDAAVTRARHGVVRRLTRSARLRRQLAMQSKVLV